MLRFDVARVHILGLIDEKHTVHCDEHLTRVLVVESKNSALRLLAAFIKDRVELAIQVVAVTDLSAEHAAIAIDGCEQHIGRVEVAAQNTFLVLVEAADLLRTLIQIPELNDRVQTACDEPLASGQQHSDLVVVRIKVLYHRPREQGKQVNLTIQTSKREAISSTLQLQSTTDPRLRHKVILALLEVLLKNGDVSICAVRQELV